MKRLDANELFELVKSNLEEQDWKVRRRPEYLAATSDDYFVMVSPKYKPEGNCLKILISRRHCGLKIYTITATNQSIKMSFTDVSETNEVPAEYCFTLMEAIRYAVNHL